jgi:2-polyprenyl-6-methoxyphenol hydroxylase-like FAD-dependent oxidoreductase
MRVQGTRSNHSSSLADNRRFLLGDRFTAADLAFACLAAQDITVHVVRIWRRSSANGVSEIAARREEDGPKTQVLAGGRHLLDGRKEPHEITHMSSVVDRPAEVLIVGAGPTGLVLALWLTRLGIDMRIIDETDEPGTTSRALAVHARTLELYRQIGLAQEVVDGGLEFAAVNVWVRGKLAGRADLGDIGRGMSPFPYVTIFPQDQHERLLIEHLHRLGVEVERRTKLLGFEERGNRVIARLTRPNGHQEECKTAYIAGCDGAHSRVREVLDIGFPGGTYERVFYVADVGVHGRVAGHELHVALDDADFLAAFPLKGEHVARLIGTVRAESETEREELTWSDVSPRALDLMQIAVDRVNWFSTYRVHHRVAERFRLSRAFLVGDAAHIHSPVGGQGMNTGIGDAVNLAWKLSAVIRGDSGERILDTYEPERIAFAKRLVATTDRAFTFVTRDGFIARHVRVDAVPHIVPKLMKLKSVRRFAFRSVSQTMLNYRRSALSEGKAGSVRGGDRLPWVLPEDASWDEDNFAPLASLDWQVHVYGKSSRKLALMCADLGLLLREFPWSSRAHRAGLAEKAAYLVRPDGYVALADPSARPENLKRYLDSHGIRASRPRYGDEFYRRREHVHP